MSQDNTDNKKQGTVNSLYVLKALCAFGVVSIHTSFLYKDYIRVLYWTVVPLFFVITGYFLYTRDREVFLNRSSKSIKKIAKLIIILNLLFLPFIPWQEISGEQYMLWFKWVFLGNTPGFEHLWYLTALLEGLVCMYVCMYVCM